MHLQFRMHLKLFPLMASSVNLLQMNAQAFSLFSLDFGMSVGELATVAQKLKLGPNMQLCDPTNCAQISKWIRVSNFA